MHEPASVLTLQLFVTGQGLQCLGRHLREMKVTVNPGSKSTFNMVRDRTAEMVSHTMMLRGVSLFLLGKAVDVLLIIVGFIGSFQHRESLLDDWVIE